MLAICAFVASLPGAERARGAPNDLRRERRRRLSASSSFMPRSVPMEVRPVLMLAPPKLIRPPKLMRPLRRRREGVEAMVSASCLPGAVSVHKAGG